jgi:hypothetical protein
VRWISLALRFFVPSVGVVGLVALALFYRANPDLPAIRVDGYGHYIYLTAIFVQKDLTFHKEVADWGEHWDPNVGLARVLDTGRYLNRFPPGVAVLMLPAFLVAHASAHLLGAPPDGFSTPYQAASALNGLLALLVGLSLLRRTLEELFTPGVVLATLVTLTFGTNLFHYGTGEASMSHIYSFALFAGLLRLVPAWYRQPTLWRTLGLGALMGLIVLVRNVNALVLLLVPLYGVFDGQTQRERLAFIRAHWRLGVPLVLGMLAVLSILFGYWHYASNRWLAYSYPGQHFYFDRPQLLPVLLSVRKGLFFWAPVLLLAVAGLIRERRRILPYVVPVGLILLLQYYLVSSWWAWHYANSFGHRAFTEFSALFALGLGAFFAGLSSPRARVTVGVLCALFVALNTLLMVQYWRGVLPTDRVTWEQYRSALLLGS